MIEEEFDALGITSRDKLDVKMKTEDYFGLAEHSEDIEEATVTLSGTRLIDPASLLKQLDRVVSITITQKDFWHE